MLKTVYGPVPSWRFGRSLGIDLILKPKTCSFNCIYCQLGKTINYVSEPENLKNYVKADEVLRDLKICLEKIELKSLDVVTFSGCGEPTLNPELEVVVEDVKNFLGGKIPTVLLTNSSTLNRENVRKAVSKFDVVCAKLDCSSDQAFKIINRPARDVSNIKSIIESVKKLRRELSGKLMIQSMFLRTAFGFTNYSDEKLRRLIESIIYIDPDVIQVDTPYRPGGERFVKSLKVDDLREIGRKFRAYFSKDQVWVFGVHDKRGKHVKWRNKRNIEENILNLLRRRPCRIVDVADVLGISYSLTQKTLEKLAAKNLVEEFKDEEVYFRARI